MASFELFTRDKCMDKDWLLKKKYTPSAPDDLKVEVDTRQNERGDIMPVIIARWKIRDDGSISYLKATMLDVLEMSTNQHLCVLYKFSDQLPMRNPSGEKWSFSVDMVEVDPGQTYLVSVINLPNPELGNTPYDISKEIAVPDCQDLKIQKSKFCEESGSLWKPNTTARHFTGFQGRSMVAVRFNTDKLAEKYSIFVRCYKSRQVHQEYAHGNNQTSLNVTVNLDDWPRTCCKFDVEIQPFFPVCDNDCVRRRTPFDRCNTTPAPAPPNPPFYLFAVIGVVLVGVVMGCIIYALYMRKNGQKGVPLTQTGGEKRKQSLPKQPPKVLIIYSQDHHLYRDIVLKLCAFLQSKCGTEVLVDLLDTTLLGTVGRLRWLEWQRQQLKSSSDKILVLCSRGVQAKWRAMCGQRWVKLREDVLSPTDDMLIPFLNLFLPDMHQPATLGKYMVAYFDDISNEQDVPSFFDIAVKYKLMKHFEELYLRILDIEKYQPDQVTHIKGIGGDEYFNCPSGRALKNAIETFQAYQLENPNWFELECVENEEEVITETNLLIDQLNIPPFLECIPLITKGPPVYTHEVAINQNNDSVYVHTPELNPECDMTSVMELKPRVNPVCQYVYPINPLVVTPPEVFTTSLYPRSHAAEPVFVAEPTLFKPPHQTENWLNLEENLSRYPTENEEEDSLVSLCQPLSEADQRIIALKKPLSLNLSPPEVRNSQPVEMEEEEVMQSSGKGPGSGSDLGYISKMSSQRESPVEEMDPLMALARLQEELFHKCTGICPETS
ncbi:interleukin 17 receptor A1a isoform 2-T2 [Polymixia lowei]